MRSQSRIFIAAAAKAAVRRVAWRAGYDIVPHASSFTDFLQQSLRSSDLLVDVGANVGQFGEHARSLGYEGGIISFEPAQETFAVLSLRAARDSAWKARKAAIGAQRGTATLSISANTTSSSLLTIEERHVNAAPKSAVVAHETVTVTTLDEELADIELKSAFLKLDVQGYEGEVLKGATETLQRTQTVHCELSVVPLYQGQADYVEVITALRDAGFSLAQVEPEFQDPRSGAVLQLEALFARSANVIDSKKPSAIASAEY